MFIPNKTVKKIRAASAAPLTFILYHLSFFICHLARLGVRMLHAACHTKRGSYCGEN